MWLRFLNGERCVAVYCQSKLVCSLHSVITKHPVSVYSLHNYWPDLKYSIVGCVELPPGPFQCVELPDPHPSTNVCVCAEEEVY